MFWLGRNVRKLGNSMTVDFQMNLYLPEFMCTCFCTEGKVSEKGLCFSYIMIDTKRKVMDVKIIHCADLHLNSSLSTHLNKEQARERNEELTASFINMVTYAKENNVKAILIAGDLFDSDVIPATLRNTLTHIIHTSPEILFFYLRGNHDDNDSFVSSMDLIPDNLKCFSESKWEYYYFSLNNGKRICITGMESEHILYDLLSVDRNDFNIVMLHGDLRNDAIDLRKLENRYIDYLALGHIHSYRKEKLSSRGIWCYSGCMEGRGFDETGEHGFVLLNIDEETMKGVTEFIPAAKRHLYEIGVDVSDCMSTIEMKDKVEEAVKGRVNASDFLRVVLTGHVNALCEKNTVSLSAMLENEFYYVETVDKTELVVDYEQYAKDASLKGEFVRLVENDKTLSNEMKGEIIRCGIMTLNGEKYETD